VLQSFESEYVAGMERYRCVDRAGGSQEAGLGSFETIGKALAHDCRDGTNATWGNELLRHNALEVERFCERARSILLS